MDFITQFLARLFEQFKAKNPTVAGIVLLVLVAITHTAHQGTLLGLYDLPEWASGALQFIGLFLIAVTGSETFRYLPPELQAKRKDGDKAQSDNTEIRYFKRWAPIRAFQTARYKIENRLALGRSQIHGQIQKQRE